MIDAIRYMGTGSGHAGDPFNTEPRKDAIDRFIERCNCERAHMSLDRDNQETPAQALILEMAPARGISSSTGRPERSTARDDQPRSRDCPRRGAPRMKIRDGVICGAETKKRYTPWRASARPDAASLSGNPPIRVIKSRAQSTFGTAQASPFPLPVERGPDVVRGSALHELAPISAPSRFGSLFRPWHEPAISLILIFRWAVTATRLHHIPEA